MASSPELSERRMKEYCTAEQQSSRSTLRERAAAAIYLVVTALALLS